jgi:hypothetical protein
MRSSLLDRLSHRSHRATSRVQLLVSIRNAKPKSSTKMNAVRTVLKQHDTQKRTFFGCIDYPAPERRTPADRLNTSSVERRMQHQSTVWRLPSAQRP